MFRFKEENSLAKRSSESLKILSKWPDKVPIIMEKSANSRVEDFPKNKFLCPADYSVHQFLSSVRKKINVGKDTALFVFINGTELAAGDTSMSVLYQLKRDDDGFLYILLSDQEVMGN